MDADEQERRRLFVAMCKQTSATFLELAKLFESDEEFWPEEEERHYKKMAQDLINFGFSLLNDPEQ